METGQNWRYGQWVWLGRGSWPQWSLLLNYYSINCLLDQSVLTKLAWTLNKNTVHCINYTKGEGVSQNTKHYDEVNDILKVFHTWELYLNILIAPSSHETYKSVDTLLHQRVILVTDNDNVKRWKVIFQGWQLHLVRTYLANISIKCSSLPQDE